MLLPCGLLLAVTAADQSAPNAPPMLSVAYDLTAFLVPTSEAARLQALLDQHGSVRLLPGDYRPTCTTTRAPHQPPFTNCSFPEANLTVRTGQRIWGLPGTRIPGVVVEPGAVGVLLSTLTLDGQTLYFPPGSSARFSGWKAPTLSSARAPKCPTSRSSG